MKLTSLLTPVGPLDYSAINDYVIRMRMHSHLGAADLRKRIYSLQGIQVAQKRLRAARVFLAHAGEKEVC